MRNLKELRESIFFSHTFSEYFVLAMAHRCIHREILLYQSHFRNLTVYNSRLGSLAKFVLLSVIVSCGKAPTPAAQKEKDSAVTTESKENRLQAKTNDSTQEKIFSNIEKKSGKTAEDTEGDVSSTLPVVQALPTVVPTVVPTEDANSSKLVPVFLAMGHAGRRLMSCDAGVSWIADKSHDDNIRCWTESSPNYVECDHNMFPGRGLAFGGDGYVYASFGWSQSSTVVKSPDGVNWEPILRRAPDTLPLLKVDINPTYDTPAVTVHNDTFAGIAAFGGRVLGGSWNASYSDDRGVTWMKGTDPKIAVDNYRGTFELPWNNKNRVIVVGNSHDAKPPAGAFSDDGGTTWAPMVGWSQCIQGAMVFGNNVLLSVGQPDGNPPTICRSTDGGASWSKNSSNLVGGTPAAVFGAGKFLIFGQDKIWESATAENESWVLKARTGIAPSDNFETVAFHEKLGVFVALRQGWGGWYEKQKMYRSVDGYAWSELGAESFKGGHPINFIKPGFVTKSTQCQGN